MTVESLQKMFRERLAELHNTERQLADAYPRMAEAACSYKVSEMLEAQAQRARAALVKLEEVHALAEETPSRGRSAQTRDCLREAITLMEEEMDLEVVDVGLLEITQRLQRHQADACRDAAEIAPVLGFKAIQGILNGMLEEEEEFVERLDALAERLLPRHAVAV